MLKVREREQEHEVSTMALRQQLRKKNRELQKLKLRAGVLDTEASGKIKVI